VLDQECRLNSQEEIGQGVECYYLSVLLTVESSCVLTTSKVSIVCLNADVQAVREVITKTKEKHVFEMGTAGA